MGDNVSSLTVNLKRTVSKTNYPDVFIEKVVYPPTHRCTDREIVYYLTQSLASKAIDTFYCGHTKPNEPMIRMFKDRLTSAT